jgi:hypothetical protein
MRASCAIMILLAACESGGYDLEPVAADSECYTLDCPLLAGGEVLARAIYFTDYDGLARAESVDVSPPELATVTIDGEYIVIRPAALAAGAVPSIESSGYGTFHVTLVDGSDFYRTFLVAPRASTAVVPDRTRVPLELFPGRKLPGERLAMFDGEAMVVYAEHRTVDGQRLLGHDDSTWTSEGVQLADIEGASDIDHALVRRVRGLATGAASVSLGGATLPLDIVPPHTTARLEIASYAAAYPANTVIYTSALASTTIRLLAYASDGRYIHGGPPFLPVTVTSSDPSIVAAGDRGIAADRQVELTGYRSGTATVTLTFDDLSIDVPVTVE